MEAASRSAKSLQRRVRASPRAVAVTLLIFSFAPLNEAFAARLGGAYYGLAIAGAIVYDPLNQTGSGFIVNIPVSFEFSKQLRVNVNFGTQYYNAGDPHGLFGTAGAASRGISCRIGASSRKCSR
jgi:hypothetical protein